MTRNAARTDELIRLAHKRAQERKQRIQAVLWAGGPPRGIQQLTDNELAEFLRMQKARAQDEQTGKTPGRVGQRILGQDPVVARTADGVPEPIVEVE